ncbi:hypothetical protein SADUNF_Sadunf10G0103700 [Salix dunnii]|uniref:Uncharacterized protein n=1 Tax=Salix dunnii TaxID=1413687 RepID=A0A835JTC4_9ROSI|nr:hypothetical protein SADUNF_Sadunf10G0103700 [Salix dunnii]
MARRLEQSCSQGRFGTPVSKPVKGGLKCGVFSFYHDLAILAINFTQDGFKLDPGKGVPSLVELKKRNI